MAAPRATSGRRRRVPPAWAVLLLAAALGTVLAAAGPAVWTRAATVSVVVDRGVSMTPSRRQAAFDRLSLPAGTAVRLVFAPPPATPADPPADPPAVAAGDGDRVIPAADVPGVFSAVPRTALATADALRRAAARAAGNGPVVVLTDRPAGDTADPPGVTRIAPPRPLANAGIDRFAVVAGSRPQAMVRVFNGTGRRRAVLRVDAVRQAVDLPPPGRTRDYFVDLPAVGPTAVAELLDDRGDASADDVAADDRAYLARRGAAARLVPRGPLPAALARFAAVYERHRAGAGTTDVAVIRDGPVADAGPALLLPSTLGPQTAGLATGRGAAAVTVDSGHPASRSLRPGLFGGVATGAAAPPGDGWRVLVRAGPAAVLAAREWPTRRLWVGFDAEALAGSPAFVVFWADALDWLGGDAADGDDGATWVAGPPRAGRVGVTTADPAVEASAGLYRVTGGENPGGDGVEAVALPAVRAALTAATPVPAVGSALESAVITRAGWAATPLSSAVGLVALGLAAAGLWAGRRLTKF